MTLVGWAVLAPAQLLHSGRHHLRIIKADGLPVALSGEPGFLVELLVSLSGLGIDQRPGGLQLEEGELAQVVGVGPLR